MAKKYGNCDKTDFPERVFKQEGQGKSTPRSAFVARTAEKAKPTGDKPDVGLIMGKKNAKNSG